MPNTVLDKLRAKVAEADADALLVTRPANVRYLSGFTSPADGRILVTEEGTTLLTDGRYTAQVEEESRIETDISPASTMWLERVSELAAPYRLAIEADHTTVAQFQELEEKLEHAPVPTTGLVTEFRLIKSPEELDTIRAAAKIADDAFSHILNVIKTGMTEVEVALELERFMRRAGAEGIAFPITVASGQRSSMPHGTASQKEIGTGELVTLDFGATVNGYHSDMTRTVAVGEVSERDEKLYDAVRSAQQAALEALAPGKDGKEVDAVARDLLTERGYGEYFSHSLGHGVGLEVHEAPSLTFRKSVTLEAGMTATVEPGAYIPGDAGVRVEDLAFITEDGFEQVSQSSKEFIQL